MQDLSHNGGDFCFFTGQQVKQELQQQQQQQQRIQIATTPNQTLPGLHVESQVAGVVVHRENLEGAAGAPQQAALPVAVPVALADHAGLYVRGTANHRDAVWVVVAAQVGGGGCGKGKGGEGRGGETGMLGEDVAAGQSVLRCRGCIALGL